MAEDTGSAKVLIKPEPLLDFCARLYSKLGVPAEDAGILADTLVTANLRGVDTHGVLRVGFYASKIAGGGIKPAVDLTPVRETVGTALLDGQDGIGQVISYRAMQLAVRKAKEAGVAYVTVRNSNHFGAAAYYAMMALPEEMIGFCTTNASPRLAPTGGVDRLFGNNPWSYAIPAGRQLPVVLDMANSVVAAGKIRIAMKEGRQIPDGWALTKEGVPTTDPQEAMQGILLAVGGYKGYGITLVMDLITGVLSNSNFGPRVQGMEVQDKPAGTSHTFIAVNVGAFDDPAQFKARMDSYIEEIKGSKKAKGSEVIYLPGEPEFIKEKDRRANGIPIQARIVEDLKDLSKQYGVPINI